jgi:uncharacterized protein (TIGR02646 family)
MRKIEDYFDNIPSVMKKTTYLDKLKMLVKHKKTNTQNIKVEGYAPTDVKNELIRVFKNRCAFCESAIAIGAHLDTDHFRPTSIYYWLAFEWSNFLLSCIKCNRDCKSNKFPISFKQTSPPIDDIEQDINTFLSKCKIRELENEGRLLLHPVLDFPEEHLEFLKNGRVIPKKNSEKGRNSIEVYGLDHWENKKGKTGKRQDLITERKKIIEHIEGEVEYALTHYDNDERLYQDILKIHIELLHKIKNHEPYSAVRHTCLKKFKQFFIDDISDKIADSDKEKLNKAYSRIQAELKK